MMAKLGEVCEVNPKIEKYEDDFKVSFVSMPKVSETGEIDTSEVRNYSEVKKGFTGFKDGDVLFAKITPCMENGKGAVAHSLMNSVGFGSTEFHVLRPKADLTTSKWLYYLTSWHEFRVLAEKHMTGSAGQKRVPKKFLEDYEINLPSLEEQRRVAGVLDKVTALMDARKQQLTHLDTLIKARFVEMFGDPVANTHGLPEATFSELGDFGRGVSKHRPRNEPALLGGPYPLIQTGDVTNANLYITEYTSTYSELGLQQSKMWNAGTLCITIAANIAKTAILAFDACFPDSVVGFKANDKTNNIFIHYWFSFFQEILEAQAPESAQKNINLKILSELKIIVPPLSLQNDFADFVAKVDGVKAQVQASLDELDTLKKSLMQTYFG